MGDPIQEQIAKMAGAGMKVGNTAMEIQGQGVPVDPTVSAIMKHAKSTTTYSMKVECSNPGCGSELETTECATMAEAQQEMQEAIEEAVNNDGWQIKNGKPVCEDCV